MLFGICSHDKDYKFCWMLNQKLGMDFSKSDSVKIASKKQAAQAEFPVYHFCEEEIFTDFYIISNKSGTTTLIPEQKKADYFLMIKGNLTQDEKNDTLKKIKETQGILTAFEINPEKLKSKQHFQF